MTKRHSGAFNRAMMDVSALAAGILASLTPAFAQPLKFAETLGCETIGAGDTIELVARHHEAGAKGQPR